MKFTAPLSILVLSIFGIGSPVWAQTCGSMLGDKQVESVELSDVKSAPLSIDYFMRRVPEVYPSEHLYPKFMDPAVERALVPQWAGTTEAPLSVKQTLLSGTSATGDYHTALLDFQIVAADKGTVKSATPGNFITLRWNEEWKGRDMSTNMGVFAPSLIGARTEENNNYMVSRDSKALVIFLHGGGTGTTGHHVATSITNYFGHRGVSVVSFDSLWHAYGPREDLSPEEYYEYLVDLRYKLAPANMPVIIGGHSMGGEHADILMRISDKFGINEAFDGYFSLSTPVDEAPGESYEVKEAAREALLAQEDIINLIPEPEHDLNVTLFLQGKVAQLSTISTSHFGSMLDWTKPDHNGANWNPALYLMGRYDALYVGREQIFEDYVTALDNTQVSIMDDRVDHHGRPVRIGHMIFDHQMPDDPTAAESFTRIKDFVAALIGEDLDSDVHIGEVGLVSNLMVDYYTNLAFRIFLEEHYYLYNRGTDLVASLGKDAEEAGKSIKRLNAEIARLKQEEGDESAERLPILSEELLEVQVNHRRVLGYLKKTYVPAEGEEHHEFAKANIAQRSDLTKQIGTIFGQRNSLEKKMKALKDPIAKNNKLLEGLVTKALYAEEAEMKDELRAVRAELEEYVEEIVTFYKQIGDENGDYSLEEIKAQTFRVDPPQELKDKYVRLDEMFRVYKDMEDRAKAFIRNLVAQGVYGEEAQAVLFKLYGSADALLDNKPLKDSLLGQEAALRKDFEAASLETSRLVFLKETLEFVYLTTVLPEHYVTRIMNGAAELDRDLSSLIEDDSTLQDFWKKWRGQHGIWKARPANEQTSLY